ncbi:MAG: XTP/dITP diphosphatase [Euryarchaeota archaeon]|nr:XTP/dITP diphosphatase [Euryarchaeota archaeon]
MRIQFATSNKGKAFEVAALLAPLGHEVVQLHEPYPEPQADTLQEVVASGLEWLAGKVEGTVMIDDSGLFIDALKGFPGVFSAHAYKTIGCDGILRLMEGAEERRARFECCAGLMIEGKCWLFTGESEGEITGESRGKGGFGFDPIFLPSGMSQTFAELPVDVKNRVSHRGRAFSALAQFLGVP